MFGGGEGGHMTGNCDDKKRGSEEAGRVVVGAETEKVCGSGWVGGEPGLQAA